MEMEYSSFISHSLIGEENKYSVVPMVSLPKVQ